MTRLLEQYARCIVPLDSCRRPLSAFAYRLVTTVSTRTRRIATSRSFRKRPPCALAFDVVYNVHQRPLVARITPRVRSARNEPLPSRRPNLPTRTLHSLFSEIPLMQHSVKVPRPAYESVWQLTSATLCLSALLACPEVLAGQATTYWVGESQSRGVSNSFTFCRPQCVPAYAQTPTLQSLEVGAERRILESKYASLSLGASLARRGWPRDGIGPDELFLGIPLLGVIEPLGRGKRFGVAVAGGTSADVSLAQASNSRPSLIAASWLSWRFSADRALVAGVRGSRAMRPHDSFFLRSRTVYVGVETR